jgi:hypothetical protein
MFYGIRSLAFALLLLTPIIPQQFVFMWVASVILGFSFCKSLSETAYYPWAQEIFLPMQGVGWENLAEINSETANTLNLRDGEEVWIESPFQRMKLKVKCSEGVHPEVVAVSIGQGHSAYGRWQKGVGVMGVSRCYKQNIAGRFGSNLIGIAAILLVPFFLIDILKDDSSAQEDCTITQVTDTVGGESEVWFLNSGGTLGGFDSDSDVNGGNPDGSFEAYLIDTGTFVITQLTDSVGLDSFPFDISAGDTLVALSSQADLTGDNPDGNREIFLFVR